MSVRQPFKSARRGAILAMVMVCLLVASLLGLSLIETVLIHHRQMQVIGRKQQCFWLAEAAVQRAERRLAADQDYDGEQWTVPAAVLGGAQPAQVKIEVVKGSKPSEASKIRVEARFPDVPIHRIVCRREFALSQE